LLRYWLVDEPEQRADQPARAYSARVLEMIRPLILGSQLSIKRLGQLVSDLVDATRINERGLELQLRRTDLVSLLRATLDEQRPIYPEHTLRMKARPGEPVFVEADGDRIAQVVANYLSNAAKYSDPGRSVSVTVTTHRNRAYVSVRDEGIGIPQEAVDSIWAQFARVEGIQHQSGSKVGLGLGLYISRDIIERHGGQTGVRSAVGKGSTFWFALPLAGAEEGQGSETETVWDAIEES